MASKAKRYELSVNELRKYPGFETISDEEALETIEQLKQLSFILYEAFQKQQKTEELIKAMRINPKT